MLTNSCIALWGSTHYIPCRCAVYHYGKLQTPKSNFNINVQFLIKNSASSHGTRWSSDGFLAHTHTNIHMHARKRHISIKGIPCRLLWLLPEQAYRGADKSLARPGRKQANVSVRMAWISFGDLPYRKKNLMTACVSILLKSRASLTCFRACFLPGRAKELSAPR